MASTTSNMGLLIPAVSDTDYPDSISSSLTSIDAHDHTSGKGVQIPAGGLASNAVTTAKILDSNVTTAKIADLNVTTAKIAANAVTRAKLEAVGQQVSSANAGLSVSGTTFTDLTNLTVTITTTGRPVMLMLINEVSSTFGNGASINVSNSVANATTAQADVAILEGSTIISQFTLRQTIPANSSGLGLSFDWPASGINHIRVVAAGTYTYKIQAATPAGTTGITFQNLKLVAFEL